MVSFSGKRMTVRFGGSLEGVDVGTMTVAVTPEGGAAGLKRSARDPPPTTSTAPTPRPWSSTSPRPTSPSPPASTPSSPSPSTARAAR
ncbi:hypothetical protein HK414_16105 [Ramlibacter terrae]|uniref:Uncharacterized protein n=1 Tax=Ramlibacter terrae TaxID=2732511 RepID=A0ABX6P5M5_9BURK|nr:hypothetical protein HK414_16105 [Ramlibacter terrae]